VFAEEKQAANPCHIAMLAMHFLEELSSSSNFFVAAAAAASFQVRCAEVWKKKEMTITGSVALAGSSAQGITLHTEKKLLLFMHSRHRSQQKAARRGEERITHTAEYIHPACSFQSVLRFRCLAVKSHCVDQSPGSSAK
jgi:hypothetical protein